MYCKVLQEPHLFSNAFCDTFRQFEYRKYNTEKYKYEI